MPVAVKLVVSPFATEAVVGLIETAVNACAVTVNFALSVTMPKPGALTEAVTVVTPSFREDAKPLGSIMATSVLEDTQLTDPDTLPVLVSE